MPTTQQLEIDIKAKSDKATTSLDALISKLNEVNSALNGLNTAKISQISKDLKGIKGVHINGGSSSGGGGKSSYNATSTVNANKRAKSSFEQLLGAVTGCNRGFRGFGGTMANLAAKWGMFYAAMYPIIRLFKFFGKEVEHSMDYVETFNYFKVTMGKIGHDAGEEFVDEFTEQVEKLKDLNRKMTGFKLGKDGELIDVNMSSLGIDPNIMMQFQAQIGAVTNSVGLLAKTSLNTQKALSMLSADLSSLKNEDLQAVMKNLQSGLIGQSRALYRYGVDITQATLKQYALAHGVTKSVSAMTQSEKIQLRLLAILQQSKVAWGDQANSINTVANQYRIMKQQISNLGRTIGNLFLPIVKTVLPYLNAFIIAMRKIFELLGKKIYGGNWQKQLTEGVSEGNFDGIVEGAEDSEEALNDATKAAKKFKQATMGFDELNIISPDTSGGSGSGIGGGGFNLDDDIAESLKEYEDTWEEAFNKMQNKAEELANKFVSYVKNHDYFGLGRWLSDGIATGLEKIDWNSLKSESDKAGKGLAELMNGLMSHRISWDIGSTVAQGLNTALTFVNSWAKTFQWDEFGTNLAIGLKAFLVNWDAGLTGETFSNFATGILKSMTSILNTSMDRNTFQTFGQKVVDFICGIKWGSLTWNMGAFIQAFYDAIIDFPADFFTGVFDRVLDKVFGEDTETRKKIDRQLKRIKFKEHFKDALTFVFGLVNPIIWIRFAFKDQTFEGVTKGIKNSWNKVVDWWNTEGATKWMTDDVKPHFSEEEWTSDGPKNGIGASWQKVTEWWATNGASFWLDRDVDPYFQKERWTHPEISEGLSESWDKFVTWWKNTGMLKWWENDVKPYFSLEQWNKFGEICGTGLQNGWNKFTEWWSTTGIYKWWTEHVAPYFDEKKWTFEGIKKGLTQAWKNAISSIKSLWNSFADHMNENFKIHIDAKEIAGHKLWDAQDFTLLRVPKFTIPAYSIGGFPEDGLFYANHNELVGQFNNGQTTVANNEQIIAGIQNGVAQAVHQELAPILRQIATNTGDTANNTDAIAKKPVQNITDRGIAKANLRGQRSLGLQLRTT